MSVSKVRGAFWTGTTAQQIRALPNHKDVRILASYLITGPGACPYGLYFVSLEMARIETNLTADELAAAFDALAELDFAHYDTSSGWVWVVEMAAQQLGAPLKATDFNVTNANRWYRTLPNNPFLAPFWDRYEADLGLGTGPHGADRREYVLRRGSGLQGAPKPLPSPIHAPSKGRSDQIRSDQRSARAKPELPWDDDLLPWFNDVFWPAYPRKTDRMKALAALRKLNPKLELRERILAAVLHQTKTIWADAELKNIPHATTWLHGERWTDQVDDSRPKLSRKTAGIARAVQDFVGGGH